MLWLVIAGVQGVHIRRSRLSVEAWTDLEGLDIRETDTLTSKCRSSDVICFSLLECRVPVRDRAVLRKLHRIFGSVESV